MREDCYYKYSCQMTNFDLLIHAGRLICPTAHLDNPGSVAVRDGRIVEIGQEIHGAARQSLDFPDAILLPGLIDLHAHPANSYSIYGVEPDQHMLMRGVTTVLSQGDAGSEHLDQFLHETIGVAKTQVRLAINLSRIGESTIGGCFENLADADVDQCVTAIERTRDHIWGIAVNASRFCCRNTDPRDVLRRGIDAAEQTELPLLYGLRCWHDWSFEEQLDQLRPGDVVTYCFRSEPFGIVKGNRIHPAVPSARDKGILFDVGHGAGSFDFSVVEAAFRDGFPPDTISTDLQLRHLDGPNHDLPLVMSKLRAVGMTENDVLTAVTQTPARVLGLHPDIGSLLTDTCADLTLLRWNEQAVDLIDTQSSTRLAPRWETLLTVREGSLFYA